MRVVQAARFGGPEVLVTSEAPDPVTGAGQVVVEVSVADVMFLDTQVRSGWGEEFFSVKPPYVPGNGVAGVVTSVGEGVDSGWVTREVIAETGERGHDGLSSAPTGGYAEQAVVAVEELIPVPEGLGLREAVALLHDGPTALQLAEAAGVQAGAWVLVAAAAGGAGVLLVQLMHALGARVIGAARGERKLELARELGAEAVVDYSEPGWTERVRKTNGGRGTDVVLDGAGGRIGRSAFEVTAAGGRFITYGASSGEFAEIDPQIAEHRGVSVVGLFDLPSLDLAEKKQLTQQALSEAPAGRIRPVIGQTFPLDRAADAHAAIEARGVIGKTLLLI